MTLPVSFFCESDNCIETVHERVAGGNINDVTQICDVIYNTGLKSHFSVTKERLGSEKSTICATSFMKDPLV